MAYRNGNYAAFFVSEYGSDNNLAAHSVKDFVYYNLLRAWKAQESSFPFVDSHNKNYNVRDGSDWERTLKPRIHDRLNKSKNIILFLSSLTRNTRALREEVKFGVDEKELPIIVVYPEYSNKSEIMNCDKGELKDKVIKLWENLPAFRDRIGSVPTIHVPNKRDIIKKALDDQDFMVSTQTEAGVYVYPC